MLFTTHYLEEAEGADAVCVLAGGKIIERGSPAEVKARHAGGLAARVAGPSLEDACLRLLDEARQ